MKSKLIEAIRLMDDQELSQYIYKLKRNKAKTCDKCNKNLYEEVRYNILVRRNAGIDMSTKIILTMCEDCFNEVVEELGVEKIKWD